MIIATHIIDGAAVAAKRADDGRIYVEYQSRLGGDLLFNVTFRESYGFTDGWADEAFFAPTPEEAFRMAPQNTGRPFRVTHVQPHFDREPQGWTALQVGKAVAWAAHTFTDERWTNVVALKFAPRAVIA